MSRTTDHYTIVVGTKCCSHGLCPLLSFDWAVRVLPLGDPSLFVWPTLFSTWESVLPFSMFFLLAVSKPTTSTFLFKNLPLSAGFSYPVGSSGKNLLLHVNRKSIANTIESDMANFGDPFRIPLPSRYLLRVPRRPLRPLFRNSEYFEKRCGHPGNLFWTAAKLLGSCCVHS